MLGVNHLDKEVIMLITTQCLIFYQQLKQMPHQKENDRGLVDLGIGRSLAQDSRSFSYHLGNRVVDSIH